ncbi:MAG TPA: ABC transporter permease subunit, partial [Tepidisphaeraceae bacterium]
MLGIAEYFWRLLPANPILLRVVSTGGKRKRDLFIRCGYLGLLTVLVIFSLLSSQDAFGNADLSKLSKVSGHIFQQMSYLQLGLVALLAPIFTAGAITQEKDSQTYDILLATPLTNGQVLFGSLLSRLFFVIALLVSGIPIFSITQIFGGVAIRSIVLSFGIAAATAFVTGALAMAIAVFKVGTRRTIFSFYLFIVIYLVGMFLLDRIPALHPTLGNLTDASGQVLKDDHGLPLPDRAMVSYFTGLHPFLALRVIFNDKTYMPPSVAQLPQGLQWWPMAWYLSSPATFYTSFMFFLSVVLVLPSILFLRRAAQSTISIQGWVLQKLHLSSGDRRRKPRVVWFNPIAWREAKTKASAARASILRYGFIASGILGALILVFCYASEKTPALYVNAASYNPIANQLSIYTGDSATTYSVTRGTTVTLNEKPIRLDDIRGRYEVLPLRLIARGTDLAVLQLKDVQRVISAEDVRKYLLGAAIIEFAVILLIVTNAAASTVTREKEDGSLDLLLTTPITSRYYIWGKLRGLVSFVLPLVAVPIASAIFFIIYDIGRFSVNNDPNARWIVFPEAVLILPGILIIVVAFASILGMHMSLRCRKTVVAVMSSVGIVVGVCATLGWCGFSFLENSGRSTGGIPALLLSGFSPFTLLTILIDPYGYGGASFNP